MSKSSSFYTTCHYLPRRPHACKTFRTTKRQLQRFFLVFVKRSGEMIKRILAIGLWSLAQILTMGLVLDGEKIKEALQNPN